MRTLTFALVIVVIISLIGSCIRYTSEPWSVTQERAERQRENERQDYKKKCEKLGGRATFDSKLAPKECSLTAPDN